ncbi:VWA domain-containing protein [Polaromonas naphthalenivorans]|nr:VWA domain-containing protein [Polaromonas naphthalenivorans]
MKILKGQRISIAKFLPNTNHAFQIELSITGISVDFSCFGLNANGKLLRDEYMIFFNQPKTSCGGISLSFTNNLAMFACDLNKLPATVESLSFTAAIDASQTMNQMQSGYFRFLSNNSEIGRFNFYGSDFNNEKSLMLGDIYRKNGEWRFNAFGQGFNGGLSALLEHFGGEEDITPLVSSVQKVQLSKALSLEKKLEKEAPQLLSLAKKLSISLEKNQLQDVIAKVAIVIDASGSMSASYKNGTIQAVIDRIVLLAARLDDDGNLDTWFYASSHKKYLDMTISNVKDYLDKNTESGFLGIIKGLGVGNNEPPVMQEVLETYKNSNLPALVIFITDGGIDKASSIKQILIEASNYPIFWQFVGVAGSGYGILEELDNMKGRAIDNAGFFAVDDLKKIKDEELYNRLLSEFPVWLKEAKKKGILANN